MKMARKWLATGALVGLFMVSTNGGLVQAEEEDRSEDEAFSVQIRAMESSESLESPESVYKDIIHMIPSKTNQVDEMFLIEKELEALPAQDIKLLRKSLDEKVSLTEE